LCQFPHQRGRKINYDIPDAEQANKQFHLPAIFANAIEKFR